MTSRLIWKLEEALEKFVSDNCDTDDWPCCPLPAEVHINLARGASLVFDTIVEASETAAQEAT